LGAVSVWAFLPIPQMDANNKITEHLRHLRETTVRNFKLPHHQQATQLDIAYTETYIETQAL